MKADEVLKILRISRSTLSHYVRDGKLEVSKLPNGRYDYDDDSVYRLVNKDVVRRTYLYARVSTEKQRDGLSGQIDMLKQFCLCNGYPVAGVFSDVASGIGPKAQKDLLRMLDDVADGKVGRVVVTSRDRLSRTGFELVQYFFRRHHCEIVALDEAGDPETDLREAPEDAADLLRCYGTKRYSVRQVHDVKKALTDAGEAAARSIG